LPQPALDGIGKRERQGLRAHSAGGHAAERLVLERALAQSRQRASARGRVAGRNGLSRYGRRGKRYAQNRRYDFPSSIHKALGFEFVKSLGRHYRAARETLRLQKITGRYKAGSLLFGASRGFYRSYTPSKQENKEQP
jgi:hypothetical protein